jgi:hypothetical protein
MMKMQPPLPRATYSTFCAFLERRIEAGQHLTEDSVRYAFFLAMLQTTAIEQHEVVLELPHPQFPGKEIDTYVAAAAARPEFFVEFKFHRASASASPSPQKAGSLFKDFSRLAALMGQDRHCLVVYLTCPEMARYFTKHSAAYSDFWQQAEGNAFTFDGVFLAKTTDTFRKASGTHVSARVSVRFCAALAKEYHLRVFDVQAAP